MTTEEEVDAEFERLYQERDSLKAELARLREALSLADDLLRRLQEWDMFWVDPKTGRASVADGRYWQDEITKARNALKETND